MTFTSQIKITSKDQASPEIRKLANELDRLGKKVETLKGKGKGLSFGSLVGASSIGSFAGNMLSNVIEQVPAAVGDSLTTLAEFERKFTFIRANAPEAISKLEDLKKQALELGASTTFDAIQVADAQKELFKKGFDAQETMAALPGVVYAAAAAEMDLAATSDIVSSALRAFGLQAKESGMVADVLAMSANISAAGIGELGMSLKYVAPVARASNQSINEIVSALSLLANAGIQASDAGTDLSQVLLNIQTQKKAKDVLKLLGINAYDSSGKMRPLLDITQELTRKTAKYSDARKTSIAKDIAGAENYKTLIFLMNQNAAEIEKVRAALKNSGGAAEEAAEIMSKDLLGAMQELDGAVQTLKISFGSLIEPAALQFLTDMSDRARLLTIALDNINKGARTGNVGDIYQGFFQANASLTPFGGGVERELNAHQQWMNRGAFSPQGQNLANQNFSGLKLVPPAMAPQDVRLTVDIKTQPGTTATITNSKGTPRTKLQGKTGNRNMPFGSYGGFNFIP